MENTFNLKSIMTLIVGVIAMIVIIPTIALIMNKTKPEKLGTMYFDRVDEDYFISIGAIYTLNLDNDNQDLTVPGYDFQPASNDDYDYQFNKAYYAFLEGMGFAFLIDRVVNDLGNDNTDFYYDGEIIISDFPITLFCIYGLSNY